MKMLLAILVVLFNGISATVLSCEEGWNVIEIVIKEEKTEVYKLSLTCEKNEGSRKASNNQTTLAHPGNNVFAMQGE